MSKALRAGWITSMKATEITGYSDGRIRQMAIRGEIRAEKVGGMWLVHRDDLLAHKAKMDALGNQRHNPWRDELGDRGRSKAE